jgi:organic hydroperoxide reductase OsmC/OhrA
MKNLTISLVNHPGTLAQVGEILGEAGISIEGGGMFVVENRGIANFLVSDGVAGRRALESAGVCVLREDEVLILRLNQDEVGQLGKLLRRMADANVNVLTQYSDHDHQLVLVVEQLQAAQAVADAWMQERAARKAMKSTAAKTRLHRYSVRVIWSGNIGSGTSSYASYSRNHEISAQGKGVIEASSDPTFRGEKTRYNPEELMVASASACHMLSYLYLCALNGVVVLSYEDNPTGEMEELIGGAGCFIRVDLHPTVTVTAASNSNLAEALHQEAHKNCFIANSLKVPVFTSPQTLVSRQENGQPGS